MRSIARLGSTSCTPRPASRIFLGPPIGRSRRFDRYFCGPGYVDRILDLACGMRTRISPERSSVRDLAHSACFAFFSILSGVTLAIVRVLQRNPVLSDLEVGFVFTLFLFALLQYEVRENSSCYSAIAHRFAGFSYGLYVLHFPFLLFFRTWLVPPERWQPSSGHRWCAASIGAGGLLYACWFHALWKQKRTLQEGG
jgi:peptidoglycan/LPS O-acetylase OafA/YrhL